MELSVVLLPLNAVLVAAAAAAVNDNAVSVWALAVALGAVAVVAIHRLGACTDRARALFARLDAT